MAVGGVARAEVVGRLAVGDGGLRVPEVGDRVVLALLVGKEHLVRDRVRVRVRRRALGRSTSLG